VRALNADRWTLDGISYGSYVASVRARASESRARWLVLDSVVPHQISGYRSAVRTFDASRCGGPPYLAAVAAPRCVGDPAYDLAAVVRARHNGTALLDALVLLGWDDWTYRASYDVPRLLHEARLGNGRRLEAMLVATARANSISADALSRGLLASKICADPNARHSAAPLAGTLATPPPRMGKEREGATQDPGASSAFPSDANTGVPRRGRLRCVTPSRTS
jgi:pimeloyl-ACP methyl ester carboxylesterase